LRSAAHSPRSNNPPSGGSAWLSKLSAPLSPRQLLSRERIAERVFRAVGGRLVLVRAPAGFGKTTVMLQLRERYEHEGIVTAWLNLDESDNDATRFLACLSEALRRVRTAVDEKGAEAQPGESVPAERPLELVDRLAANHVPFVLFLDEFEALRNPVVVALVAQLIDRIPSGAQVVIGSRKVPDIGLGRLRAHGLLVEVDPTELRLTEDEAREFLTRQRGLLLKDEQVHRLYRSTEGWIAALSMASTALERRSDPGAFIDGFAGSNAVVVEYLTEAVFSGQPEDLRDFLLKTSILESLNASLCNAVAGRRDSGEMLRRLERANLFLIPLDEGRTEYRYHSLFADFLREQCTHQEPGLASGLHRSAAEWFLAQGRPLPAIRHAIAGADWPTAIRLLEQHADSLLRGGRVRLLRHWLEALPATVRDAVPRLRLIHAWTILLTSGPRDAPAQMEGMDPAGLDDPALHAHWLAFDPVRLGQLDRIEESYALASERMPLLKPEHGFAYGVITQTLAIDCMMLGRYAEARSHADLARKAQHASASSFNLELADSVEATIDLMQGRLKQARARLRSTVRVSGEDFIAKISHNAMPGVLLAEVLYEADECAAAEQLLNVYLPLLGPLGLPDPLICAHVLLSRINADRGDDEHALSLLAELETAGHRLGLARVVAGAQLERVRQALMRGEIARAGEELETADDAALWQRIANCAFVANDVATLAIARLRWLIRSGAAAEALAPLKQQIEEAERAQRHRRALKLRILLAEALHRDGQHMLAMRNLGRALEQAADEGFVRTFLEEGEPIRSLLKEALSARLGEALPGSVDLPLASFARRIERSYSAAPAPADSLTEPLTPKEIEVLELLAQGHSNKALGNRLYISDSTVRTHLRSINMKLQAANRMQAIAIARRLGLVG